MSDRFFLWLGRRISEAKRRNPEPFIFAGTIAPTDWTIRFHEAQEDLKRFKGHWSTRDLK